MKFISILILLSIINTCKSNKNSEWIIEDIVQLNTDGLYESDLDEMETMKNQLVNTKVDFSEHKLDMEECENLSDNIYCFNAEDFKISEIKKCKVVDNLEDLRADYRIQGNELYYGSIIGRDFFKNFGLEYTSNDLKFAESNVAIVEEENINLKVLFISESKIILLGVDFAILLKRIN